MPDLPYWYTRFFSIYEVEDSKPLKWAFGALLLCYFTSFYRAPVTLTVSAAKNASHLCPPYFQSCAKLYFFESQPLGYSQNLFYAFLFSCMVGAIWFMYRQRWDMVHLCLVPLFIWHILQTFVLSFHHQGNYEFYVAVFGFTLLLFPHKEFFTKLFVVLFYVFSVFSKIHPAWVMGTYFSSMKPGLPLFPDWSIPVWTNALILLELVGAWFLMSRNWVYQRTMLVVFAAFHVYSSVLVGYRYPSNVLPMLLILFGPMYRAQAVPLNARAIAGWGLVLFCFLGQSYSHIVKGDEKLTQEATKYGLYMFDSNHQCRSRMIYVGHNGTMSQPVFDTSNQPRYRCDPYTNWFFLKQQCARPDVAAIQWKFDHSINGAPFLRIIDLPDMCGTEYSVWRHNSWIKTHDDKPQVVGRPVENYYR